MNNIKTWAQGYFVDQPQYRGWHPEEIANAAKQERHLVRPSPTGNAICECPNPDDAKWIASRLNLATELEQTPTKKPPVVIPETPIFGWKGSMANGMICFLVLPFLVWPDIGEMFLCFTAGCGWCGWAIQEKEHLTGTVIKEKDE